MLSMLTRIAHWLNPLHLFNAIRQSLELGGHPRVS